MWEWQYPGDGVSDGPYQVSDEIMNRIFEAMVEGMKFELEDLDRTYVEKMEAKEK